MVTKHDTVQETFDSEKVQEMINSTHILNYTWHNQGSFWNVCKELIRVPTCRHVRVEMLSY